MLDLFSILLAAVIIIGTATWADKKDKKKV